MVTVCGGKGQTCPFFSGGKSYIHKSFEDPAEVDGNIHDKIVAFRKTRDEIKLWLESTFKKPS